VLSLTFNPETGAFNNATDGTQYDLIKYLIQIKTDLEDEMADRSSDTSFVQACSSEIKKITNFISYFGTLNTDSVGTTFS
jgi:hypothetical protein